MFKKFFYYNFEGQDESSSPEEDWREASDTANRRSLECDGVQETCKHICLLLNQLLVDIFTYF